MKRLLVVLVAVTTAVVVAAPAYAQGHPLDSAHHDRFDSGVTCDEPEVMVDLTAGIEGENDLLVEIGPYDVNDDGVDDLIATVWVASGSQAVTNVVFTDGNTQATITSTQGISHYDVALCFEAAGGGDISPGDGDDTAGTTGAATAGPTGGTTGGTTGGAPTPTGGNLPFTGLPVWVPLLLAFGLLGSGFVLLRRKGHVS